MFLICLIKSEMLLFSAITVPSNAPNVVNLTSLSPTSLYVQWSDLRPQDCNGIITGYQIFYEKEGEFEVQVIQENNPQARSYVIEGQCVLYFLCKTLLLLKIIELSSFT